jgi:hypothetical protein
MLKKLTLTIDQRVIESAKQYAKKRNRSISRMVEDYLKNIPYNDNQIHDPAIHDAPLTNSIAGIFADDYNGQNYDEILEEALSKKYL